jgi:murein DD-endopeptidase MepM/ murein hydrolase activator NlpD
MKNFFTVTIRDENGHRLFTIHKKIKHLLSIAIVAAVLLFIAGVWSIFYFNGEIATLKSEKRALQAVNTHLECKIAERQTELDEANSRIDAIEMLIGLSAPQDIPLAHKVELAQMTSQERSFLLRSIPNGSPVPYKGISSKFGYRKHPITHKRELHRGTDLRAKMKTPVYATADAVVEFAGSRNTKGYGRLIILDHTYGFKTYYGHLNKIIVKNGQFVKKGELIGYSGNSGRSNGPHLHYEVRFIQRSLNPYWFIKWNIQNYDEIFAKIKKVPWKPLVDAVMQKRSGSLMPMLSRASVQVSPKSPAKTIH